MVLEKIIRLITCPATPLTKNETCSREELVAEEYVNFIAKHSVPAAVTLEQVRTETKRLITPVSCPADGKTLKTTETKKGSTKTH